MSVFDNELCFTKQTDGTIDQAVTASAASTNVIDLGTDGIFFTPAYLHLRVREGFTADGAATMGVTLQSDSAASFGSAATLATLYQTTEGKATFAKGLHKVIALPLQGLERFLRLYFTVGTGPMTAGKVTAYINDSPEL